MWVFHSLNPCTDFYPQFFTSCIFISHPPRPGLGDYETPFMRAFACVCLSHIFKLYVTFSCEDILPKYAENVFMAVKNMSGKIMVLILKNNMAAIADCSKIIDMF